MSNVQATIDAISSPIRREILWLVWDDELAAGEIAASFEVTAPTMSAHLAALRQAGLVTMRIDGNFRRYRASRDAVRALLPFLSVEDSKWEDADALPETGHASVTTMRLIEVSVELDVDQATAFAAFTDAESFGRWLGVPVTIRNGRFATTMEWGTRVRGTYEVLAPPDLVALRWDFEDEAVPVPGRQMVAYVRFMTRPGGGCRVEVHQHAADDAQASFTSTAWSMVLGRMREGLAADAAATKRAPRPKRISRGPAR